MQINFTTNALDNLSPKPAAYIAYHASGERGTGRIGVCVYSSGRKTFVYRHFVGKTAKFQTLGEYPSMSISSAFEKFESLYLCSDVIKVTKTSGTLANLFEAHKTDFIASGKRTYHHYKTLHSTISNSELLSGNIKRFCEKINVDSFIPRDFCRTFKTLDGQLKITKVIRDRIQHHSLHDVSSVHYDRYDYNEEKPEVLLKWENKLKEIMN